MGIARELDEVLLNNSLQSMAPSIERTASPCRSPSPSRRTGGGRTNRESGAQTPAARLTPLNSPSSSMQRDLQQGRTHWRSLSRSAASSPVNPYATYSVGAMTKQRDLLKAEVDRLRNTRNDRLTGPLPSPAARANELPSGKTQYGNCRFSNTAPLRTLYLDDTCNAQLKQRSWYGLLEAQRKRNVPHPSYDIDGDGVVSVADYKMAKKFDQDSNGIIDREEMDAGKRIIAKELWDNHRAQHYLGKEAPTNADRSMAVEHLVGISGEHGSFMREFERTKNAHWIESQRGSSQVLACISKPTTTMCQPFIQPHCVQVSVFDKSPHGRRARTRSELFETRRMDYATSVRQHTESSPFRSYDSSTILRNYQQRDFAVSQDVNSFRRNG